MAYINTLDKNGFITSTKFYDALSPDMVGNEITSFYGDTLTLFGYYEAEEAGSVINGSFVSNEDGLNKVIQLYSELLNLIASIKGDELLDLRLSNRDEPSHLRFCESLIKTLNPDFTFSKVKTSDEKIINTINELTFYLHAFFLQNVIGKDNQKNPNWSKYHALNKTTIAMMNIIQYENIEDNEELYYLVNDMMSGFNSVIFQLHTPSKDYFSKNDNYFNE